VSGVSHWRLLEERTADGRLVPARGARNMAVDEALLETVRQTGQPVVRFYTWSPACLSLGRNQRARGVYDPARTAAAGIDVVRRPTGGLAVLHDRELTYSVIAPLAPFGGPRAAYAGINRALVEGLRELGVPAEQAAGLRARSPVRDALDPCFQAPAPGEVVAGGRKLAGSAQRCERGAFLQHGSILLSGSQARVLDLMSDGRTVTTDAAASVALDELLDSEPAAEEVADAMRAGFERVFGTRLAPDELDHRESARADELAGHYATNDWTWRR